MCFRDPVSHKPILEQSRAHALGTICPEKVRSGPLWTTPQDQNQRRKDCQPAEPIRVFKGKVLLLFQRLPVPSAQLTLFTPHANSSSGPSPMPAPASPIATTTLACQGPESALLPDARPPHVHQSASDGAELPEHCSNRPFSWAELPALPTALKGSPNLLSCAADVIPCPSPTLPLPLSLHCSVAEQDRHSISRRKISNSVFSRPKTGNNNACPCLLTSCCKDPVRSPTYESAL